MISAPRASRKAYGERRALQGVSFTAERGERIAIIGPNGAGKTTLLQILAGSLKPTAARSCVEDGDGRLGAAAAGALLEALRGREPAPVRAAGEASPTSPATVERMLDQTGLRDRAGDEVGKLSGGNRQRVNIAIGLLAEPSVLLLDEPTSSLDPRQRERAVGVRRPASPRRAPRWSTRPTTSREAERYADRVLVLADGELLFSGSPRELERDRRRRRAPTSRRAFVRVPPRARALSVRWLLLKDLQILRALAAAGRAADRLLGRRRRCWPALALSSGPGKPRVAFANLVPKEQSEVALGGRKVDATQYADKLFEKVDPIRVKTREEAIAKVRVRRGARRARRSRPT